MRDADFIFKGPPVAGITRAFQNGVFGFNDFQRFSSLKQMILRCSLSVLKILRLKNVRTFLSKQRGTNDAFYSHPFIIWLYQFSLFEGKRFLFVTESAICYRIALSSRERNDDRINDFVETISLTNQLYYIVKWFE